MEYIALIEFLLYAGMVVLVMGAILCAWELMVIGVWFMAPGITLMLVQRRGVRNFIRKRD